MATTLLRKALAHSARPKGPPQVKPTQQEIDLALAYVAGRLRISDVNMAMHGRSSSSGSSGYKLARALREAYALGKIKI